MFDVRGGDAFLVMEACGSAALVDGIPGAGFTEEVTSTGARVSWGALTAITAQGGRYQLCWCARGGACLDPMEDFRLSIGSLSIAGPHLNEATCSSGQTCTIEAFRGQDLVATDLLMILDTCGIDASMGALMRKVSSLGTITVVESSDASAAFMRTTQASVAFDGELIWPGGKYQLCWCRPVLASGAHCESPADFKTPAGSLHLFGPSPNRQHRTCVSGRACPAQAVTGYGVFADDRVLLLESCGVRSVVDRFFAVDSWQLSQALSSTVNETWLWNATMPPEPETLETLEMFGWGTIPITTAGGRYRMCWCSRHARCSEPTDFSLDFGELLVIGAATSHGYTCVSGLPCQIDGLQGESLGMNQHLAVLDTCGVGMDTLVMTGMFDGSSFSWGSTPILLAGGTYRLCWCASRVPEDFPNSSNSSASNTSLASCSGTGDFALDVGSLMLLGPSPHFQHLTCTSGQKCHVDMLQGFGLTEIGYVRVMETCGILAAGVQRMPVQASVLPSTGRSAKASWDAPTSAAGGAYRLCWYSGARSFNLTNMTDEPSDLAFNVDFGTLHLLGPGPLQQDRTCVSGQTCRIGGVQGAGAELGSFLVQDTCGTLGVLPRFTNAGLMDSASDGEVSWGASKVTAAGGLYRLCWAAFQSDNFSPAMEFNRTWNGSDNFTLVRLADAADITNATNNMTRTIIPDRIVDVGEFTLIGPAPLGQDFTCIAGDACDLRPITGYHLRPNDVFAVLETCGEISAAAESTTTVRFEIPSSGVWRAPTLPAGMYRLCWCAELGAEAFNVSGHSNFSRSSCMLQQDFQVDMGHVSVLSPDPADQNLSADDVSFVPSNDTQAGPGCGSHKLYNFANRIF